MHFFDDDTVLVILSAEQLEAAGPLGHCREQICVDPHLHSEDEQPAAAGPEQQLPDGPAAGHGQVTDDIITLNRDLRVL